MNSTNNQQEMAERVLQGNMPLGSFVSHIGDRGQALRECALAVLESRGRKASAGQCEACGAASADTEREYHWQASYAPNLGRNAFIASLSVAAALLARQLGWHAESFGHIEIRTLRFHTAHRICQRCGRKIAVRKVMGVICKALLLIPTAIVLLVLAFLIPASVLAAVSALGLSPDALPFLAGAVVGLSLLSAGLIWCVGRLPALLALPASIRVIERSGFKAMTGASGGDFRVQGEVEEITLQESARRDKAAPGTGLGNKLP